MTLKVFLLLFFDNINCPTVRQLINSYNNNWFSSWLCYTSSKIYSWNGFVSINSCFNFLIYFLLKMIFLSSLSDFWNYCESSVYDRSVCASAFQWKDLQFNLLSKIPKRFECYVKKKTTLFILLIIWLWFKHNYLCFEVIAEIWKNIIVMMFSKLRLNCCYCFS